jgi:hypothetical protein
MDDFVSHPRLGKDVGFVIRRPGHLEGAKDAMEISDGNMVLG